MNTKYLFSLALLTLTSCSSSIKENNREIASVKEGKYFKEVTEEAGLPRTSTSTFNVFDYDNDGWVDFIARDKLYKNVSTNERFNFEDVTERVGLATLKGNPVFIDINNDGLIDIASNSGQVFLQKKLHHFVESSKELNLKLPENIHTISYGDFNRDGYADLVVGMNEIHKVNQFTFVPPHFYMNFGGKSFIEISNRFGFSNFNAYTRGIQWADYNNDGWADAYFSNYRLRQNFLFKNYQGKLLDVAASTNTQGENNPTKFYDEVLKAKKGPNYGHTIGSVWADFNNDGNFDLWTSNLVHKYIGPTNSGGYDYRGYVCDDSKIYRNTGAPEYRFVDMRNDSGIPLKPKGGWDVYKGDELWAQSTSADFDNDGLVDMYITQVYNFNYSHSLLYKNAGNFKFKEVSQNEGTRVIDTYAGAWADFNNDGKMDLITSGREAVGVDARMRLFKNISSDANHWLKLRIIGKKSGRNPVTTQIRVVHDKGLFLRQVEGVTGTMNQQNDPNIHFGLGTVDKIKWIEVKWSSGKKQYIKNVSVDKTYIITESN